MILNSLQNEQDLWRLGVSWASMRISSWSWVILNSWNTQTNPHKSKMTVWLSNLERSPSSQQLPGDCRHPSFRDFSHGKMILAACTSQPELWNCTELSGVTPEIKPGCASMPTPDGSCVSPCLNLCGPISSAGLGTGAGGGGCIILAKFCSSDEWNFSCACIKHSPVNCCVPSAGTKLHKPGEGGCLE